MTIDELKSLLSSGTPGVIINISETVFVDHGDHLDLDGATIYSTADPAISVSGHRWSIRNGRFRAVDGVCIDLVDSSVGYVSGMYLQTGRIDKEIVRCVGNNQCYDTLFQACELEHTPGMTVPIVMVSVDANFYNSNSWQNIRFQTNGLPQAPCVVLECNRTASWIYGNSFRDINGERPNAGLIHCRSCWGTVLDNIVIYDAHAHGGVISDDMIYFGKTANGHKSHRTTIRNYSRLGGQLDEEKYDVHVEEHYSSGLLLEQLGGTGSGTQSRLIVKCPASATRVNVQDFSETWVNF